MNDEISPVYRQLGRLKFAQATENSIESAEDLYGEKPSDHFRFKEVIQFPEIKKYAINTAAYAEGSNAAQKRNLLSANPYRLYSTIDPNPEMIKRQNTRALEQRREMAIEWDDGFQDTCLRMGKKFTEGSRVFNLTVDVFTDASNQISCEEIKIIVLAKLSELSDINFKIDKLEMPSISASLCPNRI